MKVLFINIYYIILLSLFIRLIKSISLKDLVKIIQA